MLEEMEGKSEDDYLLGEVKCVDQTEQGKYRGNSNVRLFCSVCVSI